MSHTNSTVYPANDVFDRAIARHDALIASQGLRIWVGAEPTFTDRFAETPEWLGAALGGDKEARAQQLAIVLASQSPGAVLLRSVGRQYPGEKVPRWSYGIYARRDGEPVWSGPADPLLTQDEGAGRSVRALAEHLTAALSELGWPPQLYPGSGSEEWRLVFRTDGSTPPADPQTDPRLLKQSLHGRQIPPSGLNDELAAQGTYLVIVNRVVERERSVMALELPPLPRVGDFRQLLQAIQQAGEAVGLESLILCGYPPPVNQHVRWTTVTPDPGVIEVNQAPAATVSELLAENRVLFQAAATQGLAPFRLHYNGQVDDSGGGGQLSIGGPWPDASPFFSEPQLLPRLIRYLNHHPALSYWFAPAYVGAYSQAPRPDEGIPDLFRELAIALELVGRRPFPDPEFLWSSLSPFLSDVSGNTHRSELNIEKLWNPGLGVRGKLGVVEFRGFAMAPAPEAQAALAALVRALIAMLMTHAFELPLIDWGEQLHERFSLPFYLKQDLETVLDELAEAGLELDAPVAERLLDDSARRINGLSCDGEQLELYTALEFWPQLGDTLHQSPDIRLVDASTSRLEIRISGADEASLDDWRCSVNGYSVPLRREHGNAGPVRLAGVRYRRFMPARGLHPGIGPAVPLHLDFYNHRTGRLVRARLHEWHPGGAAYAGLPGDWGEAQRRRAERLEFRSSSSASPLPGRVPTPNALSEYGLDLRRA